MEDSFVKALLSQQHLPLPVLCFGEGSIDSVAQTICACLNGAGGWIIVGVDEKHCSARPISAVFVQEIQAEVTNNMTPMPLVYVHAERYEGSNVALITIPKGGLRPYSYKGRYYILQGNVAVAPSQDEIAQLLRSSFGIRSDWERINNLYASDEDLDEKLMSDVYNKGISLGRLSKSDKGLRSLLSDLRLLRTTEIANGTVALFARDTRNLLPQCRLRIQLMLRGKDADKYEDLYFVEGNVFEVQSRTIDYFRNRLPRIAYFFKDKTGRYSDFEYPLEVLDEAISNALIHRDYTDISDEVTVFIYSDRLEIMNSGTLPENLVQRKNKVLPHGSVLRNPLMAEIFYVAGEMEKTGRGMQLISNTMKKAGRKLPEWISIEGKTMLRIYSKRDEKQLNNRLKKFLLSIGPVDSFTKSDYLTFWGDKISDRTAKNDLALLVETGRAVMEKAGPKTSYRLVK